MEVIVLGTKIDTNEITEVYDIERDKQMFLNRDAGFIIKYMDGSTQTFREKIPYDSYPRDIERIKRKWDRRKEELIEKCQQDKHDLMEIT